MAFELIITIVSKGYADSLLEASMKVGASGGTILLARGTSAREQQKIFGILIEPEKEVLLTVVDSAKTSGILAELVRICDLEKPGIGIAFTVPINSSVGLDPIT